MEDECSGAGYWTIANRYKICSLATVRRVLGNAALAANSSVGVLAELLRPIDAL